MQSYKKEFIDFCLKKRALLFGEFKLKSGRISPYFFNSGEFLDGESINELGKFYANAIKENFNEDEYDIIFGPAYKGIPLAVSTSIALKNEFNINKSYLFNRKETKGHGEITQDKKKDLIIGRLENNGRIIMIDDVFTDGATKYESIEFLNKIANNLVFKGLIISLDRQEIDNNGENAIKEFEQKTRIKVFSIVKITEILPYLSEKEVIDKTQEQKILEYFNKYGTKESKNVNNK